MYYDLLVIGEINPDLILDGDVNPEFGQVEKLVDQATLTIGSSSAIFAAGAARLGLRTAFIGKCGNDTFGRFMLDEMTARGIDVSPVRVIDGGSTGLSVILNRGSDRAILTHLGLIPSLTLADIPLDLLKRSRHVHVASYFLQTGLQVGLSSFFNTLHQMGITTSLDTNYDPTEQWAHFDELLAETNIFFPNEREALSLTHAASIEEAAAALRKKVKISVIKLGAEGAIAIHGDKTIAIKGLPVKVVDTVGAGDSFASGFIYGYLNRWPLERSLKLAVACGSLSTTAAGGTTAQPTLAEALSYVD